jgi:phosphoserine aminotransferase
MISFYPGPSRVHDDIPKFVKQAFKKGILSINHRSDEFMEMSEKTISVLKRKLEIPESYSVFYTSSATECWEILAQSLISKRSYHIFNGAFGQKWFEYTKKIVSGVRSYPFEREELINPKKLRFGNEGGGLICVTQNETSNGTQVTSTDIKALKANNPDHLVAVDATSSMGGIVLDFSAADIWLASVQKCFGLPAGLGLLICSPAAIEKAVDINENNHYNSLVFLNEMAKKLQTSYTPNVLNIYLLMRVMEEAKSIQKVHAKLQRRYEEWISFLEVETPFRHLVRNKDARSLTVIPVAGDEEMIKSVKTKAKKQGILLGEGYGDLKATTFRIANFPAIPGSEIKVLMKFLATYQ